MAQEINHVSFKILLQAHNGDVAKARQAWDQICKMGGFGDIPHTYEGGLDVKGLMHERNDKQIHMDVLKRIQDFVAGDNPYAKTRVFLNKAESNES